MENRDERPVRRVGTLTAGICLIAGGACTLLAYFWPGFDWILACKLAPIALILLGVEMVWASRGEAKSRLRYDFLSILVCCVLLGAAALASLAPVYVQLAA